LYKKQINQYILKSVKKYGIKEEMLQVQVGWPITTKKITQETFRDRDVAITFLPPNNRVKEQMKIKMKKMITSIYQTIQSAENPFFTIEINKKEIDYETEIEGNHLIVYYGEPGKQKEWRIPITHKK
jgi:hypothetical protein